jgi:uncharacterized membrane protein
MRFRPLRDAITWSHWYRLASYARGSLWIVPFFSVAIELIFSRFIQGLDARLDATLLGLDHAGALALYSTIITMSLSFLVFTFSSLLVAIQVASVQLTPRIIAATLLRDNTVRYTVGLFVFTLLYTLRAQNRMPEAVPQFTTFTVGAFGLASMVMFLYLIDYAARLLRPVSILWRVGESGLDVLRTVYPRQYGQMYADPAPLPLLGAPAAVIAHKGRSGTLLAVNHEALADLARARGGIVEFVPQIGDFIATDEPLFRLYGPAQTIAAAGLRAVVAVGAERTMEQDPTFAFRILVDIALKALSKAINDPTTAVLAIDQIHRLLRAAAWRQLQHDQMTDTAGRLLVIIRTPDWEDYVHLACREIRMQATEQIQIARRMRAMIENLVGTLPEERHTALLVELDLLNRTAEKLYGFPEDLALASVGDSQGLGGLVTPVPRVARPVPAGEVELDIKPLPGVDERTTT